MLRPSAVLRSHHAAAAVSTTIRNTGNGTPITVRWAMSYPCGRLVIHWPPVTLISPPCRMLSIPSVTTIEGMPSHATMKPMNAMARMPSSSGASQHSSSGQPATAIVPLTVASTPIRAAAEMSILPEMITIDMPIAAIAT